VLFRLDQILGLVGTLDDSQGADTSRERFRAFLHESVATGSLENLLECISQAAEEIAMNRELNELLLAWMREAD
jgi:truncated hemoglobin YjbI